MVEHIATQADGDARVAITVLRQAARTARQDGADRITRTIVDDVVPDARAVVRQRSEDELTDDQTAILAVVDELDEASMGDLSDEYEDRVEEPKARRGVRNDPPKRACKGRLKFAPPHRTRPKRA